MWLYHKQRLVCIFYAPRKQLVIRFTTYLYSFPPFVIFFVYLRLPANHLVYSYSVCNNYNNTIIQQILTKTFKNVGASRTKLSAASYGAGRISIWRPRSDDYGHRMDRSDHYHHPHHRSSLPTDSQRCSEGTKAWHRFMVYPLLLGMFLSLSDFAHKHDYWQHKRH